MSEALAIETVDLRKRFDDVDALRGVNLRVPPGSIFGFLGRNGAGKTTTIKVLLGMTRASGGHARVFGLPTDDATSSVRIRTRAAFIAIIDAGRTVVTGALDDLRGQYRRVQLVFTGDAPDITFHAPGVVRVRRQGRVMTALSSAGSDALIEEAMRFGPVSADVLPVTLKELFLETVAQEN